MATIPHAVSDITAEWLRESARLEDARAFSDLRAVSAERLAEGVGTSTEIYRLSLAYAPGAQRGPATLVAKLPSADPAIRKVARGWWLYPREVQFYRDIAATVSVRAPKCYVAEIDPTTQGFVLVLEDLHPARNGDQVAGLSLQEAGLALDQIASLHTRWWDRPELKAMETSLHPFGAGPWIGVGERHGAAWPAFEPFLVGRTSPELRRVGAAMASTLETMMADMAREPRTICHGDFRADNLMFSGPDDGLSVITLDWQAPMQARGPFDLGYLLSMSVTTDVRRAHETALLHRYHDRLVAAGVEAYGFDECFHDYRRGLLIGFTYVVQAGAAIDFSHARTEALFDSAVRRVDAAVADLGLSEFID